MQGDKHDATRIRPEYSANTRRCMQCEPPGTDRLRHASWNREANREWPGDHRKSCSSARRSSKSENEDLLHATHVSAEGTHGSVAATHEHGMATCEIGGRCEALVFA